MVMVARFPVGGHLLHTDDIGIGHGIRYAAEIIGAVLPETVLDIVSSETDFVPPGVTISIS